MTNKIRVAIIRVSIWTLETIAFLLLEAKRKQESKLDTDWQQRLPEMSKIGVACSLPVGHTWTYKRVSNMYPHLSKRQIYSILETREKLLSKKFLFEEASIVFRQKSI